MNCRKCYKRRDGERLFTAEEASLLAEALRNQEPWLEWANKREKKSFEVDPVALHVERVSPQAILRIAARQDIEPSLFADPQQQYHEAVQFYRHEIPWTNRLILGDSLQVMTSLSRREDLAGKVQMIYMDPPYGISFRSNFQSEIAIPVLISRSGFTAWGVELARQAGLTLVGRAKGRRFLCLSGAERLRFDADPLEAVPEGAERERGRGSEPEEGRACLAGGARLCLALHQGFAPDPPRAERPLEPIRAARLCAAQREWGSGASGPGGSRAAPWPFFPGYPRAVARSAPFSLRLAGRSVRDGSSRRGAARAVGGPGRRGQLALGR